MTTSINLTHHELADLAAMRQERLYAEAYQYMRGIVDNERASEIDSTRATELGNLSTWLDRAASINGNDGTFASEFVRGATSGIRERLTGEPISDDEFQGVSDKLADTVLDQVIKNQGIPSARDILARDVDSAVRGLDEGGLGLPQWGWAGTWGDWIWSPIGLGEDYVSIGGKSVRDFAENWGKSISSQGDGFSRWLRMRLGDGQDLGGDPFTGMPWPGVDPLANGDFHRARNWRQPVDPLMLDLDGDGLELKRADGSILFDHNADTIKTGTGWIGADDGILVRDLNANGTIDSGRELFGIDTLKADGKNAVNGFDALADLDSNADGQLNAADLAWSSLQVWRDLDQDGVSDAGELLGLDALRISRIGVVGSTTNATGGTQAGNTVNGNLIAQSASFTREVNGVQVNRTVGAIDLESNPFYREFTVAVPLTEQAKSLPQMQGSGRARDLAEAVSLSPTLGISLAAFGSSTANRERSLLASDWRKHG